MRLTVRLCGPILGKPVRVWSTEQYPSVADALRAISSCLQEHTEACGHVVLADESYGKIFHGCFQIHVSDETALRHKSSDLARAITTTL